MPTPETTSQRWKQIATESGAVDANGIFDLHMVFMEANTGETFTVSISGRGAANSGYWSGALMAAVAYICKQTGQPTPAGTHFETAKPNH